MTSNAKINYDYLMKFSSTLLKDRIILITGAGKGIGKACALMAHECGAKVIAVARTLSDLEDLNSQCNGELMIWAFDVSSKELHRKISALPQLHGLINNAGTNHVANMIDQPDEHIDHVIDLNIRALYQVTQAALGPMLKSQDAAIVNMSSQMGFVGSPQRTLYCMSKHAVEGLTKALAVELANDGIRVNSVAPTFVITPMTEPMLNDPEFKQFVLSMIPLGKLAVPDDVANACIYLLSDLASMVTGTSLKVDGGWTAR